MKACKLGKHLNQCAPRLTRGSASQHIPIWAASSARNCSSSSRAIKVASSCLLVNLPIKASYQPRARALQCQPAVELVDLNFGVAA